MDTDEFLHAVYAVMIEFYGLEWVGRPDDKANRVMGRTAPAPHMHLADYVDTLLDAPIHLWAPAVRWPRLPGAVTAASTWGSHTGDLVDREAWMSRSTVDVSAFPPAARRVRNRPPK